MEPKENPQLTSQNLVQGMKILQTYVPPYYFNNSNTSHVKFPHDIRGLYGLSFVPI
jgi:hypothetical protein